MKAKSGVTDLDRVVGGRCLGHFEAGLDLQAGRVYNEDLALGVPGEDKLAPSANNIRGSF